MELTIHFNRVEPTITEIRNRTNRALVYLRRDILSEAVRPGRYLWHRSPLTKFYSLEDIDKILDSFRPETDPHSWRSTSNQKWVNRFRDRVAKHHIDILYLIHQYTTMLHMQHTIIRNIELARELKAGSFTLTEKELSVLHDAENIT
jgi:hypothetical protein